MSEVHDRRMRMNSVVLLIAMVVVGMVGACSPEAQLRDDSGIVTLTPLTGTHIAATDESGEQVPEPDSSATPGSVPAASACQADAESAAVRYEIDAVLDWAAHKVQVAEYVTLRNENERVLTEIVFNIETNQEEGQFLLTRITTPPGRLIRRYTLDGTRLAVPLREALPPGCETTLVLDYTLQIPEIQDGYENGHLGYWGYSARQVNLGMWLPLVAATNDDSEWLTPAPHWLGEHFALRAADFAVELKVKNAPDNLRVAGPGTMSQPDDHIWRFEMAGAREVALSLSDQFQTLQTSTESGIEVELFYFANPDAATLDMPRHALYTAADSMALYEDLFGPYPHGRVVVVEGDFPDGMEFCGLVFVSKDWFRAWQGVPNDWLTIITAHEISHQWWYALVGNDQAQYPYLDEALAVYSEVLFFEWYYPEYLDWWWDFRVMAYEPTGYVDTSIYEFYSARGYINAIYLRGARMMHLLRADVGDEQFFGWLRAYADRMGGQMAYPVDFWGALPSDAYVRTEPTRANYLQHPDILSPPDRIP